MPQLKCVDLDAEVNIIMRLLLLLFSMLFIHSTCPKNQVVLSKEIFQHWTHSHEEDTKDIKVFRPSDYDFPPSRSRQGFEIRKNGEFVEYRISPTNGLDTFYGNWRAMERNRLVVYFEKEDIKSYTIHIISCNRDVLKIRY